LGKEMLWVIAGRYVHGGVDEEMKNPFCIPPKFWMRGRMKKETTHFVFPKICW